MNNTLTSVGGHFTWRIMIAEAVGTGIFAFAWAAVAYQRFTVAAKASAAGLALTIGIIAASSASIGLLNPAVALGIKAWVWGTYVLGPIVGAVIGVNLYTLLFAGNGPSRAATAAVPATDAKKPAARKKTRAKK